MIKNFCKIFQKQGKGFNSMNFSVRNSLNLMTFQTKSGKIILFFSSVIVCKLIEMFYRKRYPVELPEKLQNIFSTYKQTDERKNLHVQKMNLTKLETILKEQIGENDVYLIRILDSFNSESHFDNTFFYNKIFNKEKDIKNILSYIDPNQQSQYKESIIRLLGITDPNEFNDITFIIKTKEEIYFMTKSNQNPEIAKKIISGMKKINDENDLFQYLQYINDDCINIIVPRIPNISFNIIKKFFHENSYLFSETSLNFIQIPHELAKKLDLNTGEFLIFNPYFSKYESNYQDESIVKLKSRHENSSSSNKEEQELRLIRVNIFSPPKMNEILLSSKEFTQQSASSIINLDFDCKIREELVKYYKAIDLGFDEFTKFLDYMIDPLLSKESKYPENFKRRVYIVESPNLASFYKKKIFSTKEKFLYIYLNEELLNKSFINTDYELLESTISTCLSELKKDLKGDERLNRIRIIISRNPIVNNMFLIFPNNNENMTIRYIDYGKIAYYNTAIKNKNKYIIKDLSKEGNFVSSLSNHEKNYIFPLKYKFDQKEFNSKTLKEFIKKCLTDKLNNYLEEEEVEGLITTVGIRQLESLSAQNFELEILKKKGKKLVMIVDPMKIGYNTSYSFILNFMNGNQDREVKYYLYNKFNDNLKLNKFESVPYILVYEDDKIIDEINFYEVFEKEINPTNSLTNKLKNLL
jgi:hypothetical protein